MSFKVKLNFGTKKKQVNGNSQDDERDDDLEIISDGDSDENDIPDLPPGTVVVHPEPVKDDKMQFKGPEFKSGSSGTKKNRTSCAVGAVADSSVLENLFCTACGRQVNPWKTGMLKKHKELKVLICRKCYNFLESGEILQDEDGMDEQCRWCGEGGRLNVCDRCPRAFCKGCIMRNFGRSAFTAASESEVWDCYTCDPKPLAKLRKNCLAVFDAIKAANSKSSSKDSQPTASTSKSSKSKDLLSPVRSSSKPCSRVDSDPVVNRLLANVDFDEDSVVSVTKNLEQATTTFQHLLGSIQHALGNEASIENVKTRPLFSLSSQSSVGEKKKFCAKTLKKGLHTFLSSVCKIIDKQSTCQSQSSSKSNSAQHSDDGICDIDAESDSSPEECNSKQVTVNGSSGSSDKKKNSRPEKTSRKKHDHIEQPRNDKEKNSTKTREKDKIEQNTQQDKAEKEKTHIRSKEDKAKTHKPDKEKEKVHKQDQMLEKTTEHKTYQKASDKQTGETQEDMQTAEEKSAGNGDNVEDVAHIGDINIDVKDMEVDNGVDESGPSETDKTCKKRKRSTSEKSPKAAKKSSGEVQSGSESESVKTKRKASPKKPDKKSSDTNDTESSEVVAIVEEDSNLQEENLFAKLELIQELAEEFCKESEAGDKDKGEVDETGNNIDSDDDDLPEVTFGNDTVSASDKAHDLGSDEEPSSQTKTDNQTQDEQVDSQSDVPEADSDSGKKTKKDKLSLKKQGSKKGVEGQNDHYSSAEGKSDKGKKKESATKKGKPEKQKKKGTAAAEYDSDNEDLVSSDLIMSSDEDERAAKRRRLKKKQKTSVQKKQDASDDSSKETGSKKNKRRVKCTPKKGRSRKEDAKLQSEDEESADKDIYERKNKKKSKENGEEEESKKRTESKKTVEDRETSDEEKDEGERRKKKKSEDKYKKEGSKKTKTSSKETDDDKDSQDEEEENLKGKSKLKDKKDKKDSEEEEDTSTKKSVETDDDKDNEDEQVENLKGKSKQKDKKDKKDEEEDTSSKKRNVKPKRELNSSEEDEQFEKEVNNLLKAGGKKKKKKKKEEESGEEDVEEDAFEDEETSKEKTDDKEEKKTDKKVAKVKKKKEDHSDSSDADIEDADADEDEADDSAEEDMVSMSSKITKEKMDVSVDLENELAKADMLDELNEESDVEEDKEEEDTSSSESDIGMVRKKRQVKKAEDQKEEDPKEVEAKSDEDSDSDFEAAATRKRFRNKLLDAKVSESDSDIDTNRKKKGLKRKRNSDEESFKGDKSDDDDDDDDGGDSVVDSDDISSGNEFTDDSGKKKRKGKGKGKGKGKEKAKKRKRIKKMASSSEAEPMEGDEDEEPSSRKKIRKIKSDKKLDDSTKAAAKAEEERRQRVKEKQSKFNRVETTDMGKGQAPVTTKLVLEEKEENGEPVIAVDSKLIRKLKPHQVEAVQFMWDCMFESLERSKKPESSAGCILAHCMGLGKTLSVVAFVHTILANKKLTNMKTCMVVSPLNTVFNWQSEFEMWLDEEDQLEVSEMASVKQNHARADVLEDWHNDGGVMIISYDMLRNLSLGARIRNKKQKAIFHKTLIDPGPDIVVCDEGHLMKNSASALSKAMNQIKTRRRVVLTGTPLQNNLIEYHCMVDFVKPKLLGTKKEFANRFVNPIINGQHSDSTSRDVRIMKNRAHVLHELLAGCVQRRDYSALTKFLPPKQEYVISVRLSDMQVALYEEYLNRSGQVEGQITARGGRLFKDYQNLMKIWTHPWVLKLAEIRDENKMRSDDEDSFIDDDSEKSSDSDSSSKSEVSSKSYDSSAGEGTSSGRRSRRTRNDKANDNDEVVKDWKTRSRTRGVDVDDSDVEEVDAGPQAVSSEWWASHVKEEDQNRMELSGKLVLLFDILRMCEEIGDKVLVFSQSLLSLDIIEYFLEQVDTKFEEETRDKTDDELKEEFGKRWIKGEDYFRLDGSTGGQMRQHWSGIFNDPENLRARLFLISTRAGGLGINLIGANRVIIFDASWNPSHDVQSIFRVYRFGQTKPCYIYRFMAQGTMEEKIYDRQVIKLSLSQRVIDEHQVERHFTAADLAELYVFKPDRLSDDKQKKTILLPKDVLLAEIVAGEQRDWFVAIHEHDSLLENLTEQELTEEEKKAAWEEYENEKKGLFMNAAPGIAGGMGVSDYMSQEFLLTTAQALREKNPDMPQEVLQMQLQRIIMMQVQRKREEQRKLEMYERQQANQVMKVQQQYAHLQQRYMNQMGLQRGFMVPSGYSPYTQNYPTSIHARMAAPAFSAFHSGAVAAAAQNGGARPGTSQEEVEVIDIDES